MFKKLLTSHKSLALLLLRTQKEVYRSSIGSHSTKRLGEGFDFSELRPYEVGDDIKHIDWTISAKLSHPHVKVFHQEKELQAKIISFMSASLHFGTVAFKQDLLAEVVALISLSLVKKSDGYEAFIATQKLEKISKKSKQIYALRDLVQGIMDYDVLGQKLSYETLASEIYAISPQKSLLFLVGDFFECQSFDIKALAYKHELIFCIIRDRFEENPPLVDSFYVCDPLSQETSYIKPDSKSIKNYTQALKKDTMAFHKRLDSLGIRFVTLYTGENPAPKMMKMMARV